MEKRYDIGIFWNSMIEEVVLANLLCKTVLGLERRHDLPDTVIKSVEDHIKDNENTSILLFGSYLEEAYIQKLQQLTTAIQIAVYSEDDQRSTPPRTILLSKLLTKEDKESVFTKTPWIEKLLRRNTENEEWGDEYFYRGLLHFGKTRGHPDIHELIPLLLEQKLSMDVDEVMKQGEIIQTHNEFEAEDAVRRFGKTFVLNGYQCMLIIGGPTRVMPNVIAAAGYEGVDIGVNARFYANDGTTRITFYTTHANLSFLQNSPLCAGGRTRLKEATIKQRWFENPEGLIAFMKQTESTA